MALTPKHRSPGSSDWHGKRAPWCSYLLPAGVSEHTAVLEHHQRFSGALLVSFNFLLEHFGPFLRLQLHFAVDSRKVPSLLNIQNNNHFISSLQQHFWHCRWFSFRETWNNKHRIQKSRELSPYKAPTFAQHFWNSILLYLLFLSIFFFYLIIILKCIRSVSAEQ